MSAALTKFKEGFVPRYQDVLEKSLVAMKIGNSRLESHLTWGKKVKRAILDTDGLVVRDITRYSDRTISTLADNEEYLEIDKQKGVDFKLDDWDKLQNGPLKAGEEAGRRCALKLRTFIDADVLAETRNAHATFMTDDIAGGTNGTPISLSTLNLAEVIANAQAKLIANNVEQSGDMVWVVDPWIASIVNQTLIGKNISLTDLTFKNGYSGPVVGFKMFISNNLTGDVKLNISEDVTANDTVTVGGVTFKFVASLSTPAAPGEVLAGANAAASRANLIAAINGTAGAGTTYTEVSATDRAKLTNLRISAAAITNGMTITGIGAGRLTVAETLTHANNIFSLNQIHCYIGKAKQIDLVAQQDVKPDVRPEPRQKTNNVLTDALYGLKTFADSKQNFLDMRIAR